MEDTKFRKQQKYNNIMITGYFAIGDSVDVTTKEGDVIVVETNESLKNMIDEMKYSYTKQESDLLFPKKEVVYAKDESNDIFCKKPQFMKTQNGYWKCGESGFTIQWGVGQLVSQGTEIYFPIPFTFIVGDISLTSTSTSLDQRQLTITEQSLDKFTVRGAPYISNMKTFNWMAVGF